MNLNGKNSKEKKQNGRRRSRRKRKKMGGVEGDRPTGGERDEEKVVRSITLSVGRESQSRIPSLTFRAVRKPSYAPFVFVVSIAARREQSWFPLPFNATIFTSSFEQDVCSHDIVRCKPNRSLKTVVDVGRSCKMHDRIDPLLP